MSRNGFRTLVLMSGFACLGWVLVVVCIIAAWRIAVLNSALMLLAVLAAAAVVAASVLTADARDKWQTYRDDNPDEYETRRCGR